MAKTEGEFRLGSTTFNTKGKRRSSILKQPLPLQLDGNGIEGTIANRPLRRISFASHLQLKKYDKEEPGLSDELIYQPLRVTDSTSPVPKFERNEGSTLKSGECSISAPNLDWDASTLAGDGVQMEAASFISTNVIEYARNLNYCNKTVLETVDMSISGIHDKSMFGEDGEMSMSLCEVSMRVSHQSDSVDMDLVGQSFRAEASMVDMSLSPADDADLEHTEQPADNSVEEANVGDRSISQEELEAWHAENDAPASQDKSRHDMMDSNMSLSLSQAESSTEVPGEPITVPSVPASLEKSKNGMFESNMSLSLSPAESNAEIQGGPTNVPSEDHAELDNNSFVAELSGYTINLTHHRPAAGFTFVSHEISPEKTSPEKDEGDDEKSMSLCDASIPAARRSDSMDMSLVAQSFRADSSTVDMSVCPVENDDIQHVAPSFPESTEDDSSSGTDISVSQEDPAGVTLLEKSRAETVVKDPNLSLTLSQVESCEEAEPALLSVAVEDVVKPGDQISCVSKGAADEDASVSMSLCDSSQLSATDSADSTFPQISPLSKSQTLRVDMLSLSPGSSQDSDVVLAPGAAANDKANISDRSLGPPVFGQSSFHTPKKDIQDTVAEDSPGLMMSQGNSSADLAPLPALRYGDFPLGDQSSCVSKGITDVSRMSFHYQSLFGDSSLDSTKDSSALELAPESMDEASEDDESSSTDQTLSVTRYFGDSLDQLAGSGDKTFVSPRIKPVFKLPEFTSRISLNSSGSENSQDDSGLTESISAVVEPIKQMLQERDLVDHEASVASSSDIPPCSLPDSSGEADDLDSSATDGDSPPSPLSKTFVERDKSQPEELNLDVLDETIVSQEPVADISCSNGNVDDYYDNQFVNFIKVQLVHLTPYGNIEEEGVGKWTIRLTGNRTAIVLLVVIPLDVGEINLGLERTKCFAKMLIGKISQAKLDQVLHDTPKTTQFLPTLVHALRTLQRTEEAIMPKPPLTMRPPPAWTFT